MASFQNIPIRCIVFDFDGTLAELNIDFDNMRAAVKNLAACYGVDGTLLEQLYVLEMIERTAEIIAVETPGAETAFLAQAQQLVTDIEMEGARTGALFPGIASFLSALRTMGISVGVLTRNCERAVRTVYPDIDRYCDTVVTREQVRRVKPDPEHLAATLLALGTAPEESIMVGDHPMDILIGKRAGAKTVAVLSGHGNTETLRAAEPDLIVECVVDILHYIA